MRSRIAFSIDQRVSYVCQLLVVIPALSFCAADERNDAQRHQQASQQAQQLTHELLTTLLDVQLRHLAENRLQDHALYADIRGMRDDLERLVRRQMQQAIQLLTTAQLASSVEERRQSFALAREKTREIAMELLVQRQRLLRRMRVSHLETQLRELIHRESDVADLITRLPTYPSRERQTQTLSAIEAQRDAQALLRSLADSLTDISSWPGAMGGAGADGMRILQATQVAAHSAAVAELLEEGRYSDASDRQQRVLTSLRSILSIIQGIQGAGSTNQLMALKQIRDLIDRQTRLRHSTEETPLTSASVLSLVDDQLDIHQQLGILARQLQGIADTNQSIDAAKAAAYEASGSLFELQVAAALAAQSRVLASLTEMGAQIQQALDLASTDKSAEELDRIVQQLTAVQTGLLQAHERQAAVLRAIDTDPDQARQEQATVIDLLAPLTETELTGPVMAKVAAAVEASQRASGFFSASAAGQTSEAAARETKEALERALGEAHLQLDDTRRRQLAVAVGELARAAEALERAAAAQRRLSHQAANSSPTDPDSDPDATAETEREQTRIVLVLAKIGTGVRSIAPGISEQIAEAEQTARQLIRPVEPAPEMAHAVSQIQSAAATLREEQSQKAQQLIQLAEDQLRHVAGAHQNVSEAFHATRQHSDAGAGALQHAAKQIRLAQIAQYRADGQESRAVALELLDQLEQLARQQDLAIAAAESLESGRADTPLDAANQQQKVADEAGRLAQKVRGSMAADLRELARLSSQAASDCLAGRLQSAARARQDAARQLQQVIQLARRARNRPAAAQKAGKRPDSRYRAAQHLQAALEQIGQEDPQTAALLEIARQELDSPISDEQGVEPGDEQRQPSRIEDLWEQSLESLEQSIAQRMQRNWSELNRQAASATRMARNYATTYSAAAASLRHAGTVGDIQTLDGELRATLAREQLMHGLERATATLAARTELIRNDRDVARVMAQLASEQQRARDDLDEQSQIVQQQPAAEDDGGAPPAEQQRSAAEALHEAARQFAEAQRAIGQGAVDISGQQEVAQPEIREGLQVASELKEMQLADPGDRRTSQPPADPMQSPAEGANPGQPTSDSPTTDAVPAGETEEPPPQDLGTGLVPSSPEITAQQIAGEQAMQLADQLLAQGGNADQNDQKTDGQPGQSPASDDAKSNLSERSPAFDAKPAAKADGDRDIDVTSQLESEPWFVNLPAGLRDAIRASARRLSPPGYEERLRRYFESID